MKFSQYFSFSIFLFAMFVAAMLGCQENSTTAVSPSTAASEVNAENSHASDTSAEEFVIDVRSQAEWDGGHLEQAVWIPHTEVAERIAEVTEDKSAKIVLY